MGFHKHSVAKCHKCKSRKVTGGSKKSGSFSAPEKSGWKFTKTETGDWVWLCPTHAKESSNVVAKR